MTGQQTLALADALTPPLEDGDMLAAIDLGSNSFHMVVARYTLGQLRVVDRLRETVRRGMESGRLRTDLHRETVTRPIENAAVSVLDEATRSRPTPEDG
ncbi:hypothetical protein SB719_19460, partial [Pantoea sp. SIMBA_079]